MMVLCIIICTGFVLFSSPLGPVTYRVVQVATQDGTDTQPQVVTTAGLPAGAQVVVN